MKRLINFLAVCALVWVVIDLLSDLRSASTDTRNPIQKFADDCRAGGGEYIYDHYSGHRCLK